MLICIYISFAQPNLVYQNYNRGGSADLAEYSFLNIRGESAFTSDRALYRPPQAARA